MLPAVSNTEKDRRGAHVCGKKGLTGAIDSSYFFFLAMDCCICH